jgi:hypothetical protein
LEDIKARFADVQYREHALVRLLQRGIQPEHIAEAIISDEPEIIEDYPDHAYGPCCLVLGWWDDRQPLHVLLTMSDPIRLISAWDPSTDPKGRWEPGFKTRSDAERS